jgi:hypothetical protein
MELVGWCGVLLYHAYVSYSSVISIHLHTHLTIHIQLSRPIKFGQLASHHSIPNSKATKLNIPDNGRRVATPLAPEDLVAAAAEWVELPVSEKSGEETAADIG